MVSFLEAAAPADPKTQAIFEDITAAKQKMQELNVILGRLAHNNVEADIRVDALRALGQAEQVVLSATFSLFLT